MSYSSETEVSDEDLDLMKKEFNEGKIVHPEIKKENEVVYTAAIVFEENETSTFSDEYTPHQSPINNRKPYMTRSNKRFKKEEIDSEEEYDDRYYEDEASFQDDYSDVDQPDPVLMAHPVKHKVKQEKVKKEPVYQQHHQYQQQQQQLYQQQQQLQQMRMKQKPNGENKRTRKFALPWTAAESKTLAMLVNLYGAKEWQFVAKILQSKHNNNRTAAQCSQRWCRVINPAINKGPWDMREDKLLCEKFEDLQGSWCKIVKFFPDRTDTQCKRRYEKLVQLRARC
jgi:hypothetical protein